MTRSDWQEMLSSGLVLLDGATGSNLMKAGMPKGVCSEQWVLENPEPLRRLQRAYVDAGSQIVIAPTFMANVHYLTEFGLGDRVESMNARLVALSREAVEYRAFVAGDVATLGRPDISYDRMLEIYLQQAGALEQAGVDLFVVETMMGLEEAMAALEACRMVSDKPVLCTFSVTGDGMLYFGGSVYDAAPQLAGFGADAVGVNCSAGPDQLTAVIRTLTRLLPVPVIAKPNAGMPQIDDFGEAHYSMEAADFGRHMKTLRDAGARILGGCCGTTPDYIRALAQEVR